MIQAIPLNFTGHSFWTGRTFKGNFANAEDRQNVSAVD
jgi:hypothetical protein